MAINSISAASSSQWQLISTNTPTSGTTVSFTGITGYKTLMFVVANVTTASAAGTGKITFNSSNANYVASFVGYGGGSSGNTYIPFDTLQTYNNKYAGYIIVNDVLNPVSKTFNGIGWDNYSSCAGNINGVWNDTSAITSITLTSTGVAFSGSNTGVVSLYGIAA